MPEWVILAITALVIGAVVLGGSFRLRHVDRRRLDDEQRRHYAEAVLQRWREVAPDRHTAIPMDVDAWASYGLSKLEAIEVAHYLAQEGQVVLLDYGWLDRLLGEPPRRARLTKNSWQRLAPNRAPVNVYGPVNMGDGTQINSGDFVYTWNEIERDLTSLSFELQQLLRSGSVPEQERLERAATVVDDALERQSTDDSRLGSVLRWLSTFAQDTASGTAGGVIAALAGRLLGISSGS